MNGITNDQKRHDQISTAANRGYGVSATERSMGWDDSVWWRIGKAMPVDLTTGCKDMQAYARLCKGILNF
jgi:hypothetical protein